VSHFKQILLEVVNELIDGLIFLLVHNLQQDIFLIILMIGLEGLQHFLIGRELCILLQDLFSLIGV
jgi:hypothetical protein